MDIYLDLTKTANINSEYLGFSLYDAVNVNPEDDNIIVNVVHSDHENALIPIEYLEAIIKEIKETGASHIEIGFHEDHQEYEFNGFTIQRLSTEEEEQERDRAEFEKFRRNQIQVLQEELTRLQNISYEDYNNPNIEIEDDLPF